MSKARPPLVVIAGPTASGKSALALDLAERSGAVVINADSAQIYRDLPILSAAPTDEDLGRAEHRLYGAFDGARACSAADWAELAKTEIANVQRDGRLPILAGGTGLYIRTLLQGIAPVPPIQAEVRASVRAAPREENYARLESLDPVMAARLRRSDTTRIARALEVILSTGRSLAEWQLQREGGISDMVELRPLILLPPRDWLYRRCDARFARMVEAGAAAEVERLLARALPADLPVMRGIGVREIAAWLRGEADREQAVAAGQQATRRYAKRQYTWFEHQPPASWPRLREPLASEGRNAALELLAAKA